MVGDYFRRLVKPIPQQFSFGMLLIGCGLLFGQSDAVLERQSFPSSGQHQTTLVIQSQGRYSIQVQSAFGVAISVVDAMSGTMASDGTPGQKDGRIDLTLEKSTYLVKLEGVEETEGQARLIVKKFGETQTESPQLAPIEVKQVSLADFEQVRFRITLPKQQILRMEVMGRHLEDAVIWFPNGWTTGLRPTRSVYEPEPGKPMTHLEFHHSLPEGTYELVCYGGPGQTWSVTDSATPLYLRWDSRIWGEAGVHEITMSPFGRESFLLKGDTNFFEVVRDDIRETRLSWHSMNAPESSRFNDRSYATELSPKAKDSKLTLKTGRTTLPQWVTVEAAPGDKLTLRYFQWQYQPNIIPKPTRQYIGTLHEEKVAQTLGATGLLWAKPSGGDPRFVQTLLLNTNQDAGWWRQIDLQDQQEAWVRIAQKGTYTFLQEENARASAKFRMTPFNKVSSNGNSDYPFRNAGEVFDLAAGIYQLAIQPQRKGLIKIGFGPTGHTIDFTASPPPAIPEIAWSNVSLPHGGSARTYLYLPNRNRIANYTFQREWPLLLTQPLPLALYSLEARELDFDLPEPKVITVESPLQILSLDGKAFSPNTEVPEGKHTLTVHNPTNRIAYGTLGAWQPSATMVKPETQLSNASQITINEPQYFDLDQQGNRHFLWTLSKSGLYRLETTGRLPTTIAVNSRTKANLFQSIQNGQGRNALVQQYFKAGEYIVTVGVNGQAKGRLGFQITPNQLTDGGSLEMGQIEKRTLDANQSVRYQFSIEKRGNYRIQTQGLAAIFPARLEDANGWPVTTPGKSETIETPLLPGDYHYYSLATPTPSRRLTRISSLETPQPLTGKGPHMLAWGQSAQSTWRDGPPDLFQLEVTAPTKACVNLTRGMVASLDGFTEPIFGGENWERELQPGIYQFEVKRIDQDDYFNYSLQVTTEDLIPGITHSFTKLPRSFHVKLADQGLVTFDFEGQSDIRAELFRPGAEKPLSAQDDGSNDWNPHMNLRLPGGSYELKVFPVGLFQGTSRVKMSVTREVVLPTETLPIKLNRPEGHEVVRLPFKIKRDQLVHIQRTKGSQVNFSLISDSGELARQVDTLLIPLKKEKTYELWAWSSSGNGFAVSVSSQVTKPVSMTSPPPSLPKSKALFLEAPTPRTFQLEPQPDLWFSANWEHPLKPLTTPLLNLAEGQGWLAGLAKKTKVTELHMTQGRPLELLLSENKADLGIQTEGPGLLHIKTVDSQWRAALMGSHNMENPWAGMTMTASGPVLPIGNAGSHQIHLWRQTPPTAPAPLRLEFQPFELEATSEATGTQTVAPGQVRAIPLGASIKGILLSPDTFAVCWANQQAKACFHTQSEPQSYLVEPTDGQLLIFNSGKSASSFRVLSHLPYDQEGWREADQIHWERAWSTSGKIDLEIDDRIGSLHAKGEGVTLRFFGRDGSFWEGSPPFSKPFRAGKLSIDHSKGWISLWHSESDRGARAWFGKVDSSGPLPDGDLELNGTARSFQITVDEPQFLQFAMDQPGILAIEKGHKTIQLNSAGDGHTPTLAQYFQPGSYQLLVRPFNFSIPSARLSKQRIQIQTGISDSPAFISKEETQVFQFEVTQKAKVGLGLKSSSDHLQACLIEANGAIMANGNLIIEILPPGRYFLVVHNPDQPVLFQPVLLGLDGSKIDIPDEVMKQYFTSR